MVSVATSELLDEQLDEIRLVLKNSTVEHYPPTTEVKIEFYADGELEETLYAIVADGRGKEYLSVDKSEKGVI